MNQKNVRKRICVSRSIQGSILWTMAKYWIFYHVGLWTILFSIEFYQQVVSALLLSKPFSIGEFCAKFVSNHWFFLTAPVVLFPVILWDMLHVTHKVAGPLVRFGIVLRQLAAGERVERVTLRKGDLLTEFQDTFNEFLASDARRKDLAATNGAESSILDEVSMLNGELRNENLQPSS